MAGPVDVEWSADALADLDRFATLLHDQHPDLARRVAHELINGLVAELRVELPAVACRFERRTLSAD